LLIFVAIRNGFDIASFSYVLLTNIRIGNDMCVLFLQKGIDFENGRRWTPPPQEKEIHLLARVVIFRMVDFGWLRAFLGTVDEQLGVCFLFGLVLPWCSLKFSLECDSWIYGILLTGTTGLNGLKVFNHTPRHAY
jgi:hypothetical protein